MEEGYPYPYLAGKVADVMTKKPEVINEGESLANLIEIFRKNDYNGYPVISEDGRLVGLVRDTDVLSMFARKEPTIFSFRVVADVMHTPPLVINAEDTIQQAIIKMFADQTRILVVLDKEKSILGVITRTDLIRGMRMRSEPEEPAG
jgi:predicted transcriptional regulator